MSTDIRYRPLDGWEGPHTEAAARTWARYDATLDRIHDELTAAFDNLEAEEASILVQVKPSAIRMDGFLKAGATPAPAVALTVLTKHGPLRFQCDKFTEWQGNLRCIALTLDRLRLIDRDGCAVGGQAYTGWLAIEQTTGTSMTRTEAARLLCEATAETVGEDPRQLERVARTARSLYTEAARLHHPDRGGDAGYFARLGQARDTLLAPLEIGAGHG